MTKLRPQYFVDDITVIRHENKSRRVFVETADGEDSLLMPNRSNDVASHVGFTCRRYPHRFVVLDIDGLIPPRNNLTIAGNHVANASLVSQFGGSTVEGDATGLDQSIGLSTRADSVLCKEFIDADSNAHKRDNRAILLKTFCGIVTKAVQLGL